jgi:hypothetical protein
MPQGAKVAGSFPYEVTGFFSIGLILPSALPVLGSSQLLSEISTRNLPADNARPLGKCYNLSATCETIV